MKLSEKDARHFFRLYPSLLVYVNQQKNILGKISTPEEFMEVPPEERIQVRDELYQDIKIIDWFVQDNPYKFSSEELEIVSSWNHFLQDQFILFRHLKKYSIFLSSSSPVAYGVLSLADSLKDMYPQVPVFVEAVLLPFKNQIVYDGYIQAYNLLFGGGMRRELNDVYNEAKASYGIITSLPFEPRSEKQSSDEDKLKFYLKNERNRNYYWEEIEELITGNHELTLLFHQEMGKVQARSLGKKLREIGFKNGWFGILEGMIVASGKTKEDLNKNIQSVVPKSMQEYVYLYQLKEKKRKK